MDAVAAFIREGYDDDRILLAYPQLEAADIEAVRNELAAVELQRMRFMLDNCVDAELGNYLRQHGHDAFTAADVGISDANDDTISVAAQERGAALISHDIEFSRVRRRRTIGQHRKTFCVSVPGVGTSP